MENPQKPKKFDYKKEYRALYLPGKEPATLTAPPLPCVMVDGTGAPEDPSYQESVSLLYAIGFTIKMSKMGCAVPKGYFEYAMFPLEGLWYHPAPGDGQGQGQAQPAAATPPAAAKPAAQTPAAAGAQPATALPTLPGYAEGLRTLLATTRHHWRWTSLMCQPSFVTEEIFNRARDAAAKKKPELNFNRARFATLDEGLCVQVMHLGPYADEPETFARLFRYMEANGLSPAPGVPQHHEIYLSNPQRSAPQNLKTVIRLACRKG